MDVAGSTLACNTTEKVSDLGVIGVLLELVEGNDSGSGLVTDDAGLDAGQRPGKCGGDRFVIEGKRVGREMGDRCERVTELAVEENHLVLRPAGELENSVAECDGFARASRAGDENVWGTIVERHDDGGAPLITTHHPLVGFVRVLAK
jgi:hypothetical protein